MKPYYEEKGIVIYHGDCREVLPTLEPVDLVFTSPPYNLGEGMEDKGGLRIGHRGSAWPVAELASGYDTHDDALPYPEYVEQQQSVLELCWQLLSNEGAIYYNHKPRVVKGLLRTPLSWIALPVRQVVIWDRGSGFNHQTGAYKPLHEWIVIIAKPGFRLSSKSASDCGDVWRINPDTNNPHPAPFPVDLPKRALATTPARSVLDPFMGSGSTLRAAKEQGIRGIGIEQSERYCEIAARRLSQEVFNFAVNE